MEADRRLCWESVEAMFIGVFAYLVTQMEKGLITCLMCYQLNDKSSHRFIIIFTFYKHIDYGGATTAHIFLICVCLIVKSINSWVTVVQLPMYFCYLCSADSGPQPAICCWSKVLLQTPKLWRDQDSTVGFHLRWVTTGSTSSLHPPFSPVSPQGYIGENRDEGTQRFGARRELRGPMPLLCANEAVAS